MECVAAFVATKTVKNLARGRDDKRWRFFAMKGAQALEVGAGLFKRNMFIDHLDDIGGPKNGFNLFTRDCWHVGLTSDVWCLMSAYLTNIKLQTFSIS